MIPIYQPWLTNKEIEYATDAVKSGWISSKGSYTDKLEESFSKFVGCRHCIATNTGTAACHLAMATLGIGPGDEVIVPAMTFIATANAVSYCGATPVPVDVDPTTWNIDISKIEEAITPRTRAIFPVHLYGNPCDMTLLRDICTTRQLYLVEDAAESVGAKFHGRMTGSIGDIGCFSLYGNKTITSGEGGLVVCDNDTWAGYCTSLRGQGQTSTYFHQYIGFNYRMTNVAAAIALAQLERFDEIMIEKTRVYETYREELGNLVGWQIVPNGGKHGLWVVAITTSDKLGVMARLDIAEVEHRSFFYPICDMPPYRHLGNSPIARTLYEDGIVLPSYPELSNAQIKYICDNIKDVL